MPKYTDDEIRNMKKTIDHIQKVGHIHNGRSDHAQQYIRLGKSVIDKVEI